MKWFDYLLAAAMGTILAVLAARAVKAETPSPGVAYCSLYARESTRVDLMHTIPVKPENVSDEYIKALAVQVFKECVSVLPALLPLPEQHRGLDTWISDMRYLLVQRAGTVPATAAIPDDDLWRQQCEAQYRTWDPDTGTVVRAGSPDRVKCPCGGEVDCTTQ
jgi:hypothetical protein